MADRQHAGAKVKVLSFVCGDESQFFERVQTAPRGGAWNSGAMTNLRDRHPALLIRQREQYRESSCQPGDEIGIPGKVRDRLGGERIGIEQRPRSGRRVASIRAERSHDLHEIRRVQPLYPTARGSHKTVSGTKEIIARTTIAANMNGPASRTIAISGCLVMFAMTNSNNPKGGVNSPIMTLTTTTTPKWTRSRPNALAVGIMIGTITRSIVVPSRRHPRTNRIALTRRR